MEREVLNTEDPNAVAIVDFQEGKKRIVGHIPREISRVLSYFIAHGGEAKCVVKGERQHSPLPQGGLEIPCSITLLHGNK